jgi:CubicO group peptidase (beta-lactamase class C family)
VTYARLPLHLLFVLAIAAPACAGSADKSTEDPAGGAALAVEVDPELREQLDRIDTIIDNKRRELHVPGVALAIIKDGKIVHARGYGYRDLEKKLPVTPQTQFAIGSATKAFTALATLMADQEGKLSLGDSPKSCVPYFKLQDPEADKDITIKNLLTHSSGLGRTDQSWVFGDLSAEDVIRIAGLAKPLVKLNEAFNYQNAMFTTAGVCTANALGTDYPSLIAQRVFKPLGMTGSNMTIAEFEKAEHALGYEIRNDEDGEPEGVIGAWLMDLTPQAPAGAINSSIEDMAKWLAFVLDRGKTNELVSADRMEQFLSPQMKISEESNYALGWFVDKWRNKKKVHHGGNVAGFSAMVAMLPEEDLGYVMLTNLSATPLAATIDDAVFSLAMPKKAGVLLRERADPGDPATKVVGEELPLEKEAGTYELGTDPKYMLEAAVALEKDKLVLRIPGQPPYELTRVEGRKFKFLPPEAPRAFYVTFRQNEQDASKSEAYVEQPGAASVLRKVSDDPAAGLGAFEPPKQDTKSMKDLLGVYEAPKMRLGLSPKIVLQDDRVVVSGVGGLQGLVLTPAEEKDTYGLHGAPGVSVLIRRGEKGAVEGFTVDVQGRQTIIFDRTGDLPPQLPKPKISVAKLMAKVAKAQGSKKLASYETMLVKARTVREHEGMEVDVISIQDASGKASTRLTFTALGRSLMTTGEVFDGENGYVELGKYEPRKIRGRGLTDLRVASAFNPILDYEKVYESVEVKKMVMLDDKKAYVIENKPKDGSVITLYVDAKSNRIVRRDRRPLGSSATSEEHFEDFRKVNGVTMPFKITTGSGATRAVTEITEVKFDEKLPEDAFKPRGPVYDPTPLDVVSAGSP